MRISFELSVQTNHSAAEFLARVLDGFVTTTDEAEEFRAALEAAVDPRPATFTNAATGSVERAALEVALTTTGWNIAGTARVLRVSRATVRSRIERYGLTRPGT